MPYAVARSLILVGVWLALCMDYGRAQDPSTEKSPTQLTFTDNVVGTGTEIKTGAYAVMHYTGWVYDPAAPQGKGHQFVSSRERGESLSYVYGYGRALQGLERGMKGMRAGGTRTIVIPPKLGYDDLKHPSPPDVPKGAALVFVVELLNVVPQSAPPDQ